MSNRLESISGKQRQMHGAVSEAGAGWVGVWVVFLCVLLLAFSCDDVVTEIVRRNGVGFSKGVAAGISFFGDFLGIMTLGALVWVVAWRRNLGSVKRLVLMMMASAVLSGAASNVVRAVCGRSRPFAKVTPGWYGAKEGASLSRASHAFQSFPSSHTAVVAGFFAPLALMSGGFRRRVALVGSVGGAVGATLLMAWARVWNGSHHVSDVVAGAFLGLVLGVVLLKMQRRKWPAGVWEESPKQPGSQGE